MELIYLRVLVSGQKYNFIYTYKAPNLKEQLFLDKLEDFIHSINLNEPLFMIGDFNMDYNNKINSNIRKFLNHNDLINFVNKPTRISTKYYKKSNTTKRSSTMIDLILHNGNLINCTDVIECPFSDHHFIVAKLDLKKSAVCVKQIECRNLSADNIRRINSMIDEIDFKQMRNYDDINAKWLFIKNNSNY